MFHPTQLLLAIIGAYALGSLSPLAVWLYCRLAIKQARNRCDGGLRQLRTDLESQVKEEAAAREKAIRDLAKTILENDEIAAECVSEIENLFDLKLAEVVSEITRRRDSRGRFAARKA